MELRWKEQTGTPGVMSGPAHRGVAVGSVPGRKLACDEARMPGRKGPCGGGKTDVLDFDEEGREYLEEREMLFRGQR